MYSTDKFCKALEEILEERINSGRRGELTIELPERYTIPVSGKPNPWDYVEDIRPILRLSEKSLGLILEAHLELLTGTEEIEDMVAAVRDKVKDIYNKADEDSGKYIT